ncbi:serine/threonine-protein phosphatase [Nocardioides guangzhouensis]|uniref:Serine/threonine-protein phosphatase n=1 Tax=Nocardioides guangzhouensis TaxID=2497878 RepID=A0A4Q4ZBW5_9ACTN|nr:protein phosphatase 2C domain-containing protein [Nocardioides guangzhouensis]RYP84801.1 serine/threonine-protein phosphatase [Nocardioides guangzhouensis]
MVHLHSGAATDVGRVREINQDSYLASSRVFVVADGMGGHHGGEVASAIVVEEFGRLAEQGYDSTRGTEVVTECLRSAQQRIRDYGAEHRSGGQPDWYAGTTVVAALLCEDEEGPTWLLVNLGDSRIYRVHDGRLDQVSVDHSVVQELLDAGEIDAAAAAVHPERHVITRALGGPVLREPDFFVLPLASAARVVLCSDGVSGMIGDDEMEEILRGSEDPRDAAERIVAAAVHAGGQDNATAVVVDVVGLAESGSHDARTALVSLEEKLGALP